MEMHLARLMTEVLGSQADGFLHSHLGPLSLVSCTTGSTKSIQWRPFYSADASSDKYAKGEAT